MKKTVKSIDNLIKNYLTKNPKVKEALKVFNTSIKDYENSMNSLKAKQSSVNFKTTNSDG